MMMAVEPATIVVLTNFAMIAVPFDVNAVSPVAVLVAPEFVARPRQCWPNQPCPLICFDFEL